MKAILYHGYLVRGSAKKRVVGVWRSRVRITWSAGRQEFTFDDPTCFASQSEAEAYALKIGKNWVDDRLQGKM